MSNKEMEKKLAERLELSEMAEDKVQETYRMIRQMAAESEAGGYAGRTGEAVRRAHEKNRKPVKKKWMLSPAVAAACLTLAVTAAASAYVVTQTDFVDNFFGKGSRGSIEAHTEVIEGNKGTVEVTYPAKEYVDAEEGMVKKLLGDSVSAPQITRQIGDYTLTLQYVITDGISANVSYKLECENGVEAIEWEPIDNELKGANFTDERDFYFYLVDENGEMLFGKTLVDAENSTDTSLYLYNAIPFKNPQKKEDETWTLHIEQYEKSVGEANEEYQQTGEYDNPIVWEEDIPFEVRPIALQEHRSAENNELQFVYSPMSASFIFANGIIDRSVYQEERMAAEAGKEPNAGGLAEAETENELPNPELYVDGWFIKYVALEYKDGTTYVVQSDDEANPVDNTNYIAGVGEQSEYWTYLFNRLVDWDQVAKVIVNDTVIEMQ